MSSLLDYIAQEEAAEKTPGRRGRPRSDASRKSIMDATSKLLITNSVRELTIEGIAKKAKVGKTTIYRWWPSKVAVILDMLSDQLSDAPPLPTTSTTAQALEKFLERFLRLVKGRNGKLLIETLAEAQADPDALTLFYERFMLSHEQTMGNLIERGKKNGEFRKDIETGLAVDMIVGAVVYRLQSGSDSLDGDFLQELPVQAIALLKK